jgi:F-type H+-transporting ATPase subunit c
MIERRRKMLKKLISKLLTVLTTMSVALLTSPVVYAAEALPKGETSDKVIFAVGGMIAAGLSVGLGAFGAGLGIGTAANGACVAVGRNPGVQGKIMTTMLVGMAMAESCVIYALVISLVILYANPFTALITG